MLSSSFISAWYHLRGDKDQRDTAAYSCCALRASLTGASDEQMMTRDIDMEQIWRRTMRQERIGPSRFPLWSTLALAVLVLAFLRW
jgi:hypothetical protein